MLTSSTTTGPELPEHPVAAGPVRGAEQARPAEARQRRSPVTEGSAGRSSTVSGPSTCGGSGNASTLLGVGLGRLVALAPGQAEAGDERERDDDPREQPDPAAGGPEVEHPTDFGNPDAFGYPRPVAHASGDGRL